jgi:adenylate cyclase
VSGQRKVLAVDDVPANLRLLEAILIPHDYAVLTAASGDEALAMVAAERPDIVLLDVMMPGIDGYEVCRRLRADQASSMLPIVMVTASDRHDKARAMDMGADDFITKPVDAAELVARVRSLLRIKEYHDRIEAQAAELAEWNRTLEERVERQLGEMERLGRLRRFLSPQLADLIVSSGSEDLLESHRREITVVFCDLRGFTAFAETAEPEDVMDVLRDYHAAMGELIFRFEGTLKDIYGDGMMVFFNDPVPCPDPAERAVRMAIAMRERTARLARNWSRLGYDLGFGVGIAQGHATMGRIGFEGRFDYGAVGSVVNLASRLCGEAQAGQILISARVQAQIDGSMAVQPVGSLVLKGFHRAVDAFDVVAGSSDA